MTEHATADATASPLDPAAILDWFDAHERDLPWRRPGTTAWGVLVSEIMSQQTPVARVAPVWQEWMDRWPTPADFAAASRSEVLRAWGTLGYPRRALRLWECARAITADHAGKVPADVDTLLALPGIGDYTARAVACFHYGRNVPVVDTNVRRVHGRAVGGEFLPPRPSKKELAAVAEHVPDDAHGPRFSAALMELGALVCTAKNPRCAECPVVDRCAWQLAGCPQPSSADLAAAKKRVQKFAGTDRQVRGRIMALLRAADEPVSQEQIDAVWADGPQLSRALASLLADGLAEQDPDQRFRLPQ